LSSLKYNVLFYPQVDTILEVSNNQQTKYYGLLILEDVIKTRWKVLPRKQCEQIKKYIIGLIMKTSSDPETLDKEKTCLNKLDIILVQVSYIY
jgi:exportin-1